MKDESTIGEIESFRKVYKLCKAFDESVLLLMQLRFRGCLLICTWMS